MNKQLCFSNGNYCQLYGNMVMYNQLPILKKEIAIY